jgi:hypothetical protein
MRGQTMIFIFFSSPRLLVFLGKHVEKMAVSIHRCVLPVSISESL